MRGRNVWVTAATLLFCIAWVHAAAPSPAAAVVPSPTSASTDADKEALIEAMKSSGFALSLTTYFMLGLGVLVNVDVTPLLWHAQWITFAPFLEGYAGNNTIIWEEVAPPKGNNPNGVVFRYEEWSSHFYPLALNISWLDMQDSIAVEFDACSNEDMDSSAAEATPSSSNSTSGSRRLLEKHPPRRLENVESCSFQDMRNIKRATTFVNVCFSYLIFGVLAFVLQIGSHFIFGKKWITYLGGTHWIKERDDLDKASVWTFFYIPFQGPRIVFAYFYYVAFQPMAFGCMLAMSTGSIKFILSGSGVFVVCIVVPLIFQFVWVKKHVMGKDLSTLDPLIHKCVYKQDWKGWRDVEDRQTTLSWRKSKTTAGFGILFKDYSPKWKGWYSNIEWCFVFFHSMFF